MVKEIILCVEGGGDAHSRARFREGIGRLLNDLRLEALGQGVRWQVIPGGSRSNTYDEFMRMHAERGDGALVLLVVDSEGPVDRSPREHLIRADKWNLSGVLDDQVHLMVQAMEAWLLADPDALERYYGKGFTPGLLPKTQIVENIPKDDLEPALRPVTRRIASTTRPATPSPSWRSSTRTRCANGRRISTALSRRFALISSPDAVRPLWIILPHRLR